MKTMTMRWLRHSGYCYIILLLFIENSWCDNISNVNVSIQHPARLSLGERVTVSFDYSTNYSGGFRIFVRPMTKGSLSPNYAAHPSEIYNARRGKASGFFTISKGNVTVDHIRIQIVASNGNNLFTKFVPAKLHFSNNPMNALPVMKVVDEPMLKMTNPNIPPSDKKEKRTILPNGNVEISYPDGSRKILYDGGFTIIFPDGKEQKSSYMSVQIDTPPMLPAEQSIVEWLNAINEHLLSTIQKLVDQDETAMNYYIQKENQATSNLYEKMRLRTAYIDRLLTK